jgi:hypothetical protein
MRDTHYISSLSSTFMTRNIASPSPQSLEADASFTHIIVLNAMFIFCFIYISAVFGHHQVCASPDKIISLYALFCHKPILNVYSLS